MDLDLSLYAEKALAQVPRLLSLGDREPGSATYGCFDRYYWHYRILDFSNARFQEAAWLLALLYKYQLPGSSYHGKEKLRKWALAAVDFWAKAQRSDGSVDEVYPWEHSFVATAFTTFAVSEALLILGESGPQRALKRAGDWLASHDNPLVANQVAGAAAALYNLHLLTGEEKHAAAAQRQITRLLERQAGEGYFYEYGGFDMGYLSICLGYLVRYQAKSGDEKALNAIEKGITFSGEWVGPQGGYDYSQTSRHTQYIYPYAFLREPGRTLLERHLKGVAADSVVTPGWMDDRFCLPLTIDYLATYIGAVAP
jgi:hypothetical protein